jgi:RNAse (barnase) inhibitor barstar
MPVFNNDPSEWQRLDWTILQDNSPNIYWRQQYLEEDIAWLESEGYQIVRLDCSSWSDDNLFHTDLYKKVQFPDYYGRNFNALNDCMRDLESREAGLVIVLEHFDAWDSEMGQALIEIFDRASRFHLLLGERIMVLIQVNDPKATFEPIKSTAPIWNRREWLNKDRVEK